MEHQKRRRQESHNGHSRELKAHVKKETRASAGTRSRAGTVTPAIDWERCGRDGGRLLDFLGGAAKSMTGKLQH